MLFDSKKSYKLIPNTSNFYISEEGEIFTNSRKVSTHKDNRGYLRVNIIYNGEWKVKTVHFLVALTYIGNPPGKMGTRSRDYQVNHIDCNKLNNHYSNLEWITGEENIQHAKENKLFKPNYGEEHCNAILTNEIVFVIRTRASQGETAKKLAQEFGFDEGNVRRIIKGYTWKTAPGPITKDNITGSLYKIISPSGEEFSTTNLAGFCKKHNLHNANMSAVANGKARHYNNWTVLKIQKSKIITPKTKAYENKFVWTLITPEGKTFSTTNLKEFCRGYEKLSYKTLTNFNWEYKEYKGWKMTKRLYE